MQKSRLKKISSYLVNALTIAAPAVSFVSCTDYGAVAPSEVEEASECCTGLTRYEKCYNYYIEHLYDHDCQKAKEEAQKTDE